MFSGRTITVPLDLALDQSIDPGSSDRFPAFADCVNYRRDKENRLVKRYAYRQGNQPSAVAGTVALIAARGELAHISPSDIQVRDPSDTWRTPAQSYIPQVSRRSRKVVVPISVPTGTTTHPAARVVALGGYVAVFWITTAIPYMAVLDGATGAFVRPPAAISASLVNTLAIDAVVSGTSIYIGIVDGNNLQATSISLANLLTGSFALTLISAIAAGSVDVGVSGSNIVFAFTTTTPGVRLETRTTAFVAVNNFAFAVAATMVAVVATATRIWAFWNNTAAVGVPNVRVWDNALAALAPAVAGTALFGGLVPIRRVGGTRFISDNQAVFMTDYGISNFTYAAGAISKPLDNVYTPYSAVSQPFIYNSELCVWAQSEAGGGATPSPTCYYALYRLTNANTILVPSGTALPQCVACVGRVASLPAGTLAKIASDNASSDSFFVQEPLLELTSGVQKFSVEIVPFFSLTAGSGAEFLPCNVNDVAYCGGGGVFCGFDTTNFFDISPQSPQSLSLTTSGVGGSIAAGTYQYALTYEFRDRAGNVYQSDAAYQQVTYVGATSSATFSPAFSDPLSLRQGDTLCKAVLWRTTAGPGSIFYRLPTLTDTFTDAQISSNAILYISQGEVTNEPWPSVYQAIVFGNRIAAIDAEFRDRIVFSKPLVFGRGPEHSSIYETFVRGIGELTAIAEMDGILYAFSDSAVATAAYGEGLDATGGSAGWPSPQIISRVAGTVDPRTLCVTQDGIVFVSKAVDRLRVWLLPRGSQNVVEIGHKIKDYLTNYSVCVQCLNDPYESKVYVTLLNPTVTTVQLVYDYRQRGQDGLGLWGAEISANDANSISRGLIFNRTHWRGALSGAHVDSYSYGRYDDNAGADAGVTTQITFHQTKIGGLKSYGRLNGLHFTFESVGVKSGDTQVLISLGIDNEAGVFALPVFSISETGIVERQWQPPVKRSSGGFTLSWAEAPTGAFGPDRQGSVPKSLTIDYVQQPGTHRTRGGQKL